MSWYRETEKPTAPKYSPPTVTEQKLAAGGNYVSAATPASGTIGAGSGTTLGTSNPE